MQPTVIFRDFEERDIDFIYHCKNDEKLNSMIVGQYHPFTYEEATEWVHGCMGEHETYKFWAIATADKEKRIVGWVSISQIDENNKSACFHGIVIGDNDYNDGMAWIEAYNFILYYVFDVLNFHRLFGNNLLTNKKSHIIASAFFFVNSGISRDALCVKGVYYDIENYDLLDQEYYYHKQNNDYEIYNIIDRILKLSKKNN